MWLERSGEWGMGVKGGGGSGKEDSSSRRGRGGGGGRESNDVGRRVS